MWPCGTTYRMERNPKQATRYPRNILWEFRMKRNYLQSAHALHLALCRPAKQANAIKYDKVLHRSWSGDAEEKSTKIHKSEIAAQIFHFAFHFGWLKAISFVCCSAGKRNGKCSIRWTRDWLLIYFGDDLSCFATAGIANSKLFSKTSKCVRFESRALSPWKQFQFALDLLVGPSKLAYTALIGPCMAHAARYH